MTFLVLQIDISYFLDKQKALYNSKENLLLVYILSKYTLGKRQKFKKFNG